MLLLNTSSYSSLFINSLVFRTIQITVLSHLVLLCIYSYLQIFLKLFFKWIIFVPSLKFVDASNLDSLLMHFSFTSCLRLNRYLIFERFFPFVTQWLYAYFLTCLTTVLFHLPFDMFCKSVWAVGILNFSMRVHRQKLLSCLADYFDR